LAVGKVVMNILCRVDASFGLGTGHLMRCLALSQAGAIESITTTFLIQPSSLEYCMSREDWVGKIVILPESLPQEDEIFWIKNNLNLNEYDLFLVDGYQFLNAYNLQSKTMMMPLVIFDDYNDEGVSDVDMIINSSSHAVNLGYEKTSEKALLALGEKYRILRQEFTQLKLPIPSMGERTSLTIIMGGSDSLKLTLPLLKELELKKLALREFQQLNIELPINVITGSAYKDVSLLSDFIQSSELTINHYHNCQNVAEHFLQSKLVVSAAGGCQFELSACATPSLLVVVADNQFATTRQAERLGACKMIDFRDRVDIELLGDQLIELWNDNKCLEKIHLYTKSAYASHGSENLIQLMRSLSESYEY